MPFDTQTDRVTKTGSGQSIGKDEKNDSFSRLNRPARAHDRRFHPFEGRNIRCRKRVFFAMPLCTKSRTFAKTGSGQTYENSKKRGNFLRLAAEAPHVLQSHGEGWHGLQGGRIKRGDATAGAGKTASRFLRGCHLNLKHPNIFAKTGSGQTSGKLETRDVFCRSGRRSWLARTPKRGNRAARCGKRTFWSR